MVCYRFPGRPDRRFLSVMLLAYLLLPALLSCDMTPTHEAFLSFHESDVGREMEEVYSGTYIVPYMLEGKILPNGNSEYGFARRGTCEVYYEVDPETRIIVAWRWQGLKEDCIHGG